MVKLKIPKPYQMWLFILLGMAWTTGLTFFILKTWFIVEGEFGPEKHPWQFTALQIHGGVAFLMMVTYGFLLGSHIPYAWKVRPLRKLGLVVVAIPALLMITAYLLYYIAEDDAREIVGYVHLAIGFSFPAFLVAHILCKPQRKIKKNKLKQSKIDKKNKREKSKRQFVP